MEYPTTNDFYLKFKAIYNKNSNFIDYVLTFASENFSRVSKINTDLIIGEKLSDIVIENDNILGLKEIYFNMMPRAKSKYETYIENLGRWYIINVFSDKEDLIIFYCDITEIRKNLILSNNCSHLIDLSVNCFKDNLTNLYNRNFFEEELVRLDTKRQLPITIIMGDINGLKLINDAFGHGMGDKVLKSAANIMKKHFRKEDIVSRIGGDEFMILLPKTSEETGQSIVNRLKSFCENNPVDIIKMSISFGVATKEKEYEDINKIVKKAEEKMYFNKLKESKEAKQAMIAFLKSRLEKITFETKAHYERLKNLSLMLANEVGISEMEKEELRLLCEFHDIGKIGVPSIILQKEGALNSEEWEDIKRHSEIGYHIVKEFRDTLPIDELILVHHERWDGKGYPGLYKDKQIPIVVRIFAIADAYEAMVNDRPYKERMTHDQALKEILDKAGSQFDPNLANMFVKLMDKKQLVG